MPKAPLTVKVPGKLMIAGEFAVLEPYQKLVVMAVDRFVYAKIDPSVENRLTLENFNLHNIKWDYINNRVTIHAKDKRICFVKDAMTITMNYLSETQQAPANFTLSIRSELDDISGIKYGLGSSAAVVTSVVTAILKKYLPYNPTAELIFKLAAISHVKTQGNGSGADIAASAYGGVLLYSSFQANWLENEIRITSTLTELIEKKWTFYSVKSIQLPKNVYMCIGWTGKPASTANLVNKILKLKEKNAAQYRQFLTDSETAVNTFLQGIDKDSTTLLLKGIRKNRQSLSMVGKSANVEIETPLLQALCDIAEKLDGAGKPSGAGGGDCGIAFVSSEEKSIRLRNTWKEAGIKPLIIGVQPYGAASIN